MGSLRRAPSIGAAADGVADPPEKLGANKSRMQIFRRPGWLQSTKHGTGKFPDFDHSAPNRVQRLSPKQQSFPFIAYSDPDISTIGAKRVAEKQSPYCVVVICCRLGKALHAKVSSQGDGSFHNDLSGHPGMRR